MSYSAFVTTLTNVHKHSNADRLLVADCFGNSVIVGTDMYEGQKVIYFPVDGQLSEEFAVENNLLRKKDENGKNIGGYLDPEKRNITALKLRGEKSDGLVMPIEVLSKYCKIEELTEGQMITTLGGKEICCKYIPRHNSRPNNGPSRKEKAKKKKLVTYPYFEEHIDTEQLAYNKHMFKPGDTIYITLKMHGTSQRTSYTLAEREIPRKGLAKLFRCKPKMVKGYEYVSGTRRCVLENFENGFYGSDKFRQPWHDFFKDKLYEGEEVFYEVVGYTDTGTFIMGEGDNKKVDKALGDKSFSTQYGKITQFTYGCEPNQSAMYIYRMTMTTPQGTVIEYPWEQVQLRAKQMGANTVPQFDKFIYTTEEDLMRRVESFYEGPDPVGKTHLREGVVVRIDNRSKFTAYKHKGFAFKVLEGIIKENADAPDIEEAQDEKA